jgi:competence protein ComEC
MKWFKGLSTAKKVLLIVSILLLLLISAAKTYLPKFGLTPWSKDINFISDGKPDEADNKPLSVHFIDVGQGDCTLIKTENGNVLIDCGNSINGEEISQYLLSHNVKTLDYLVITHPHSDHYGGATRLVDFIEVKNVLMREIDEKYYEDERDFLYLVKKLNKMNVPFVQARAGDTYSFGEAIFTVLPFLENTDSVNDMSLVLRLDYGDTSFLFMGDCEQAAEKLLTQSDFNLKCDVLKVSHHGSSKGSSMEFLKLCNPLIAVVSCGYGNEYGHPAEDVLYRLKKNNAEVLRTDLNGTVVTGNDGEKIYCEFEKGVRH